MAASTQVKDAFVEFVENVPFYGAALLCVDHPEVQSIIPRLRDRRDRHLRLRRPGRRARRECRRRCPAATASTSSLRDRARRGPHDRRASSCRCPGRHNVQNALAAIGVAAELGIADEVDRARLRQVPRRQAPLHQGRRGRRRHRSSTITATIRSRSRRCSSAAREGARGPGDRGRPAAPLHPPAAI